jgi:LysM repeat protein
MRTLNRVLMALLALVICVGGIGFAAQPAQAAGCAYWHYVRYGETLAWIGRMYNVPWTSIAAANGINNPRWIYAGTSLCIPTWNWGGPNTGGPYTGGPGPSGVRLWSFTAAAVEPGVKVGIQGYNLPSNIRINVMMGVPDGNHYNFTNLGDLDTDSGNNKYYELPLNTEPYKSSPSIKLRFTQTKKNGRSFQQDVLFYNTAYGGTGGLPNSGGPYVNNWTPWGPGYWWGVPTIWISQVRRDNSVTFVTNNYPANLNFQVYMGPMGSGGVGGIPVGSFNSGAGGSFSVTVPIPPALYGSYQIAIRTQSTWGGFYSYNWFYNNNAY